MEDVKVCRICLNMDVKMNNLEGYPLESYFASVMVESKPLYKLPPYACYECAALVKKFYLFRQKCLRSETLLCGIYNDCGMLTPTVIKSIDRQSLLTVANLTHQIVVQENKEHSPNVERPEFAVEVIKKEDHDDINIPGHITLAQGSCDDVVIPGHITPDQGTSDDNYDDGCKENKMKKSIKKVDVEKVEILVKMDIEETSEFDDTTVETPKLQLKKARITQSKKQSRSRRTVRTVDKKKLRTVEKKVTKDDIPSDEENAELEDITVVTLSLEEQIAEINKRKQSSNYLNCPYQCQLCFKGFNNANTWKHHVTRHSPCSGEIECTICKYRFKTKRNLQRHMLNHGRKYVCQLCSYSSCNVTTVKQHQGSHKGITHKCNYCDEVFTVRTTYVSHMRIKHPSENICGYCGYSFYSKQGLVVHKNMVHKDVVKAEEENEGPYCVECDVKFISTEAYKRHMVMSVKHTQTTDSINGCRVCGATFTDSEELRLHHRKEHPKRQPKHYRLKTAVHDKWPAKCEHCTEEIPNARAYWKHFRLMHPNENYPVQKKCVCDICGKGFMCNAILKMHKRTHFGERPYKCAHCDKACFTAFDLRVHQQKHSDMRPFPCSICSKAFKRKEALGRHLKIHSGENPYKCEICGVAFNKSCTRTLHVRTVHTKEPAPPRKRRNKLNK